MKRAAPWLMVLVVSAAMLPAARAEAVDLIGTWHVLVHYKDSATDHPERERWVDRVWKFEREGSRLAWTVGYSRWRKRLTSWR